MNRNLRFFFFFLFSLIVSAKLFTLLVLEKALCLLSLKILQSRVAFSFHLNCVVYV